MKQKYCSSVEERVPEEGKASQELVMGLESPTTDIYH